MPWSAAVVGVVIPGILSLLIVGSGIWVWQSSASISNPLRFATWAYGGVLFVGFNMGLVGAHQILTNGVIFINPVVVAQGITGGALVGLIVGIYENRFLRSDRELRLVKRAADEVGRSMVMTDADGTIEYVNDEFERQTGYTKEEAIGRNPRILKSGKHDKAFYAELWATILAGEMWQAELINRQKNGELYRVDQVITPVTDSSGTITHFVGIEADITNRHLREQQLSVFNRILRYNLQNDVSMIKEYASVLGDEVDEEERREYVKTIQTFADGLIALAEDAAAAQTLIDKQSGPSSTVRLSEMLRGLSADFETEYPNATFIVAIPDEIEFQANDSLRLAIREAAENAVVHNDQSEPRVTIRASRSEVTEADDWIALSIVDDGPTIPAPEREVLEADKETASIIGTGLGFWIMRWVVEGFGGEITAAENHPRGNIVTFHLPEANTAMT